MKVHELAGKPAPRSLLANIPRLISAYYTHKPDVSVPAQRVVFGTSGHRGSSLRNSFNEDHIIAISQAIYEYRKSKQINGPLFMGMDTHALSEAALATAVEVFAAHGIDVMIQKGLRYTPTPVISHAILTYNRGRDSGFADGVVGRAPAAQEVAVGVEDLYPGGHIDDVEVVFPVDGHRPGLLKPAVGDSASPPDRLQLSGGSLVAVAALHRDN